MMFRLFLLLVLGLTTIGHAFAQNTGSRMSREARSEDGGRLLENITECITARRPELARRWLELLPGSAEEAALLNKEAKDLDLCMESVSSTLSDDEQMEFKPRVLRRPVATVTIARMLAQAPAASPLPKESEAWFVQKLAAVPTATGIDRASLVFQDFGHCVAVNQWAGTLALLASKPDSVEEAAAIKMLTPVLGPCLSEGANITLTPANLRIVLAEPVYHLLKLGASPAPAGDR